MLVTKDRLTYTLVDGRKMRPIDVTVKRCGAYLPALSDELAYSHICSNEEMADEVEMHPFARAYNFD